MCVNHLSIGFGFCIDSLKPNKAERLRNPFLYSKNTLGEGDSTQPLIEPIQTSNNFGKCWTVEKYFMISYRCRCLITFDWFFF